MNSRRHLLPAIYNANLERFHFAACNDSDPNTNTEVVEIKQESAENEAEAIIWIQNEDEIWDVDSSGSESELEHVGGREGGGGYKKTINICVL